MLIDESLIEESHSLSYVSSVSESEGSREAYKPFSFPDDEDEELVDYGPPDDEPLPEEVESAQEQPAPEPNEPEIQGNFFIQGNHIIHVKNNEDGESVLTNVCSIIYVRALVRDFDANEWGKLVEWRDMDGNKHEWIIPSDMLMETINPRYTKILSLSGLTIFNENLLTEYLILQNPTARVRGVFSLGWKNGDYVFPSDIISSHSISERVVFRGNAEAHALYTASGTFEDWQDYAKFASGNSRLIFALCCSFAGPLLKIANVKSGGFNLVGLSSKGKSTALE